MKLLGIGGSARRNGVSEKVLRAFLETASEQQWETESIYVSEPDLSGCRGCFACEKTGECVQKGDAVSRIYEAVVPGSDIILVSCPVYFMGIPWPLKRLIDRAQLLYARRMRGDGTYPERGISGFVLVSGTAPRKSLRGPRLVLRSFLKELGYPCEFEGWVDAWETDGRPVEKRIEEIRASFSTFLAEHQSI